MISTNVQMEREFYIEKIERHGKNLILRCTEKPEDNCCTVIFDTDCHEPEEIGDILDAIKEDKTIKLNVSLIR